MTIFYKGQVIVLDEFPAEKAMEIMMLAARGTPKQEQPLPVVSGNVFNILLVPKIAVRKYQIYEKEGTEFINTQQNAHLSMISVPVPKIMVSNL